MVGVRLTSYTYSLYRDPNAMESVSEHLVKESGIFKALAYSRRGRNVFLCVCVQHFLYLYNCVWSLDISDLTETNEHSLNS